jgi:leucyl aminopeptidase (aminopeptidase T)
MPFDGKLPALGVLSCLLAGAAQAGGPLASTDPASVARRFVAAAGLREGDLVLLCGSARDSALLERLASHARSAGARAIVTLDGERLYRPMFANGVVGDDPHTPAFAARLAQTVTAQIIVEFGVDPGAARGATTPQALYARSLRQVYLENDSYPTGSRAEFYGIVEAGLATVFWDAVALDPARLQASADGLRATLTAGQELRLRHANGTDLKLRIEGRSVRSSSGAVSRSDARGNGASRSVWLPAGQAFFLPVPGSAEGTIVVERQTFRGRDVRGLRLSYEAGKLTSMTAKEGLAPLKAAYAAAGPGKDVLGAIDIGIEPAVRGSGLRHFAPAGMVTAFLGDNLWAGGDNAAAFSLVSLLGGATVSVDGRVVIEDGALRF